MADKIMKKKEKKLNAFFNILHAVVYLSFRMISFLSFLLRKGVIKNKDEEHERECYVKEKRNTKRTAVKEQWRKNVKDF